MSLDLCASTRAWIARSASRSELVDFGYWLEAERYNSFVADQHLRRLAFMLERLSADGRQRVYSVRQLERAFALECRPKSRLFRFAGSRRAYARYLLSKGRLRVELRTDRHGTLRRNYERHLVELRGFSSSTRQHHAIEVREFLSRGLPRGKLLRRISREDIERYIGIRSREVSRHSLTHVVGILRSFMRYLYLSGYTNTRLDAIDAPKTYQGERPPKSLPWATVRRLLASVDRRSKAGWRDLCILHLLAYYGLRPSEVAPLRVDSIDWDSGVINVRQRKTRSDLQLPLAAPTLRLLRQYLIHSRNEQGTLHPELFLRARCPSGPIERYAVQDIFQKRAREAGLPPSLHVYQLRHTFAMRLLARGVGVKAIGDVMGHRSLLSTWPYLRLDIRALRGVALPVPAMRCSTEAVHHA
jgi:site-specific recombinase XerD